MKRNESAVPQISTPEAVSEYVPLLALVEPAIPTGPTSALLQVLELDAPATVTESSVAVVTVELLWLVTARPTYTVVAIGTFLEPTLVHEAPSYELYAVKVLPDRVSRTQYG